MGVSVVVFDGIEGNELSFEENGRENIRPYFALDTLSIL